MAQAGRDPLWRAALAVANQDAVDSGETCLRCHMPKGWLEGRSTPEDGTAMTADDREGVQCSVCHRMVDPFADPENPTEDAAILAALADPVPAFGNAMMVVDPEARMRGPFDIIGDLGSDPHIPDRTTIISPFHESSDMCGTCHNLRNPVFTRDAMGNYVPNPLDTPGDPTLGFPEQVTYDEWAASEYATTGVIAPQFGRNKDTVSTCQDCHMPDVSGKDANTGLTRDDVPLHTFEGANTFIPTVLPHHPAFGSEVDADVMADSVEVAIRNLRKAATMSMSLNAGDLTVTVRNETGHKLPTGYPEGRRMWLHVRAFDADRNVIFESGRYVFSTADLLGYEALPMDPDYDPYLYVWETIHGLSPGWAMTLGLNPGPSFHLVLNDTIEFDNRIPPRGFTNAAFDAFDGDPVGVTFLDGQYWDDVVYPVGVDAVQAEATLYYQTASKEYIEFLRDTDVTTASGNILFDLWNDHGKSEPVVMAYGFLETDTDVVNRCHKSVSKNQARYQKKYAREWAKCFGSEAKGLSCDETRRDERVAKAAEKLRERVGGAKDKKCAGVNLTPMSIGHGDAAPSICPAPCSHITLFDNASLADCAACTADHLAGQTLDAAYGSEPPDLPPTVSGDPGKCQKLIAKASVKLSAAWAKALASCEDDNRTGANNPAEDCSTDPDGDIADAMAKASNKISKCTDFTGLAGCGGAGTAMDVQTCVESAIGAAAPVFTEVAYP